MDRRKQVLTAVIGFLVSLILAGCAPKPASIPGMRPGEVARMISKEFGMRPPQIMPTLPGAWEGGAYVLYCGKFIPEETTYDKHIGYHIVLSSDRPNARVLEVEFHVSRDLAPYSDEFLDLAKEYLPLCATVAAYTGAQPETARAWVIEVLESLGGDLNRAKCVIGGVEFEMYWAKDFTGLDYIDLTLTPYVGQGD